MYMALMHMVLVHIALIRKALAGTEALVGIKQS